MTKKRRRRRNWSDAEKLMICGQTRVPGVSVSQVARRYDVNANQVFNWLKDPRFLDAAPPEAEMADQFLPVEIIDHEPVSAPTPCHGNPVEAGVLEIETSDGSRLRVLGKYDADVLARLIRSLSS